tara:strand:+ start:666 stop:1319 length:654 start_codon:yes stop_codon:yes gene_type:complete
MKEFVIRFLTSLLLLFLIYLSLNNVVFLFLFLLILNYFTILEFQKIFEKIFKKKKILYFISTLISVIYILFFSLLVWFNLIPLTNAKIIPFIFLLIICISTDVGGLIIGKLFGGKKLTKISPKKTYSGSIGSFLFSIFFGYFFYLLFNDYLNSNINFILIIVLISLISQIGDLIISFLKRKAKMKDTGSILPGHGGILDRIDGILLAIPFGIILISI